MKAMLLMLNAMLLAAMSAAGSRPSSTTKNANAPTSCTAFSAAGVPKRSSGFIRRQSRRGIPPVPYSARSAGRPYQYSSSPRPSADDATVATAAPAIPHAGNPHLPKIST